MAEILLQFTNHPNEPSSYLVIVETGVEAQSGIHSRHRDAIRYRRLLGRRYALIRRRERVGGKRNVVARQRIGAEILTMLGGYLLLPSSRAGFHLTRDRFCDRRDKTAQGPTCFESRA